MSVTPHKGYADAPTGQVHYAECGAGLPVLLLHQTPRSWREYVEVLPLLGQRVRAIAVDTPGFGESALEGPVTIERFADGIAGLIDSLGVERFALVGHHTGGVVAVELAARFGSRVEALVLSGTSFMTAEKRARAHERPLIDWVDPRTDGGHLVDLWQRRRDFYRPGEERFLNTFVADALRVLDDVEEGHHACRRYVMEPRLLEISAPVTVISGRDDRFAEPSLAPMAETFGADVHLLDGHVPLPEQNPEGFARAVIDALERATAG